MAGNKKNGYLRGSAAGRNGFGMAISFYCEACEKEHGPAVEKVGIQSAFGREAFVCNRTYLKYMDSKFDYERDHDLNDNNKSLTQLKRLKTKIGLAGDKGLKHRVKFLSIVFSYNLYNIIQAGDAFDEFGISDRDFHTCFEMNDSDQVIYELIKQSKNDLWLKLSLINHTHSNTYSQFLKVYDRVNSPLIAPDLNNQISMVI